MSIPLDIKVRKTLKNGQTHRISLSNFLLTQHLQLT